MDKNLRELLELAVGEPPRWVSQDAIRRQAVRRRATQTGFAGLAVVVAAGLTLAFSAGAFRPSAPAADGGHRHAGPPPYYVIQDRQGTSDVTQVRSTATSRVTATVPYPKGMTCGGGNTAFAAAKDSTVFMLCTIWHVKHHGGHGAGKITALDTFVYRFQVTGSGKLSGYSRVKGSELKGVWGYDLAASPDGSQVAVEVIKPGPAKVIYTNSVPEGIFVISTKTGHKVLWSTGPYRAGAVQYADGSAISFARDGSELAVTEDRCHRSRYQANCSGDGWQVRVYHGAEHGGSLEGGQVVLSSDSLSQAFITPDGSALNELSIKYYPHQDAKLTIERVAIATGHAVTIYQTRMGPPPYGILLQIFSADPSGAYLFINASTEKQAQTGWIDHGRLVPLKPVGRSVLGGAW
ncbi:MAG TPA: hypothetical protein VMA95_21070 [Streptosporangiaceae bacterium]|nr:hypothetical protein [Streptosporangiaceae bacterium]